MDETYRIKDEDQLPTPALVFYEDKIRSNLRSMQGLLGGFAKLRPHIKTHKCAEIVALQREAGIARFKCATPKEAELLAQGGVAEVLLAYPMTGPLARRAATLKRRYPWLVLDVLADSPLHLRWLSEACRAEGVELGVLVDVNTGMDRTGVSAAEAERIARALRGTAGLRFAGLHAYGSRPVRGTLEDRAPEYRAALEAVVGIRRRLEGGGIGVPRVVAGGTLDCGIAARTEGIDETSPGTFVLWDKGYEEIMPGRFTYAALVLGRVISRPTPSHFAVDAGYKAVSADPPLPHCEVLSMPGSTVVGRWEEHLVVRLPKPSPDPAIGTVVYLAPVHICSTVNLWDEAVIINGHGEVVGRWPIAARGH
jgi:D-serine deaminase-like pyridoxal phosphate-dependent protein